MAVIPVINQNIPLASKLDQKKGTEIDPIQIHCLSWVLNTGLEEMEENGKSDLRG